MKHRLTALILAGVLVLALAACGGAPAAGDPTAAPVLPGDAAGTPIPAPDTTEAPVAAPTPDQATPPPQDDAVPTDTPDAPDASAEPTPPAPVEVTPAPSKAPDSTPAPADAPVATPAPTPEPTPEPTQEVKNVTAAEVYRAVSKVTGGSALADSTYAVEFIYSQLNVSDLEDYCYYIPAGDSIVQEIFIAKAKSGKVSSVKAACQTQLDYQKGEAAKYADNGVYVASGQIVTEGDWVMLCICQNASAAVNAFKGAVN